MAENQIHLTREIVTRKDAIARGLKYYFTGKPCPKGHVENHYVGGGCVVCARTRVRAANSLKYKTDDAYRNKALEDSRQRRLAIKSDPKRLEDENAGFRRRYQEKANDPEWRKQARDKWREMKREYYRNNPQACKAQNHKRRARMMGAEGYHTADDIIRILAEQNYKCVYCPADLTESYHVDHIMPLALGGPNWPENIQCLCPPCNISKGAKHPDDFAKEKARR